MKKIILASLFTFLISSQAWGIERTVTWYKHKDLDVVGYKLYVGTQTGVYTEVIDIPDRAIVKYKLDLPAGTYYIALSAYTIVNGFEVESDKTYELKVRFALAIVDGFKTA
jgi:hypothetical protein